MHNIITIRGENIYNGLQAIVSITSLCELFSIKPDEDSTPDGSYAFFTIVSNITNGNSQIGYLFKTARVSVHITCKKYLLTNETQERVLGNIIDAISNAIVTRGDQKISTIDGFTINSIKEDVVSPIFIENNRYYQVKDYIFNYISVDNG